MLSFECDYAEGAHEKVLQALFESNAEQLKACGCDKYSDSAKEKIRAAFNLPDAEIFFLTGGTQTNQVVIDTMLRSYDGVISATTGHVNGHEAGAIEYSGHKVLALPGHDGKLDADEVDAYVGGFFADENHEHMVFPGMVYISHPTEYGTLYTKVELQALHKVCRKYNLPLYLDGARLGYGLMSDDADFTAQELGKLVDIFYIGGTKVGALCGEALVFSGVKAPAHFPTLIKQHGAMLAKGRLTGVQFDALFTDNLYFSIARHAIEQAQKLKNLLAHHGLPFFMHSPTNQQFVIVEDTVLPKLKEKVAFCFWEKADATHSVLRFATSWFTTDAMLSELDAILTEVLQ